MDLCTVEDVEARLGRPLSTEESARADAAIADVSAYLYTQAPLIPDEPPVPEAVVGVAARLSMRVIVSDPDSLGIVSEGLGGYQTTYRNLDQLALSKVEKAMLRPWRVLSGIGAVQIDATTAVAGG